MFGTYHSSFLLDLLLRLYFFHTCATHDFLFHGLFALKEKIINSMSGLVQPEMVEWKLHGLIPLHFSELLSYMYFI